MDLNPIFQKELGLEVSSSRPLSGGDINEVLLVNEEFVIKLNDAEAFPEMMRLEADGLNAMRETNTIQIPEVYAQGTHEEQQYLILEKIEKGNRDQSYWERIASGIADMHRTTNENFGWKEDNYIGRLNQKNDFYSNWTEFFIHCRMEPLVESAFNKQLLRPEHLRKFDGLYNELDAIFPQEKPALLHGDLWGGNLMDGLIDPAVYFGHREMDLAMTQMFGGSSSNFIELYHENFPLEKGIDQRIPVYNLYPNLTHLNMFGSSYLFGIESLIRRF